MNSLRLALMILLAASCAVSTASPAEPVVINEIHYHPDNKSESAEFVELLQVEPDFWPGSKPVPEAQRRVGGDGALAVQYLGHTIDRDVELAGELGGGHVEFAQFFGEVLAGVDGGAGHDRGFLCRSMIVCDFDVARTGGAVRDMPAATLKTRRR